jgi:hypothetical protein
VYRLEGWMVLKKGASHLGSPWDENWFFFRGMIPISFVADWSAEPDLQGRALVHERC